MIAVKMVVPDSPAAKAQCVEFFPGAGRVAQAFCDMGGLALTFEKFSSGGSTPIPLQDMNSSRGFISAFVMLCRLVRSD